MTVELTNRACKDLDGLRRAQPVLFDKVASKIQMLAKNPTMGKALVGPLKGKRSLRVGDWRILYEVGQAIVLVLTVNHRREVYK
ncbi:MAG: type II toxin-antitoxin system RelE/ParE family toxin [Ignavibacteriales bacterium]|nr:type II toxin-antitoxin system RelE/ParE family toxin [Ignavibacteriales bacterium]